VALVNFIDRAKAFALLRYDCEKITMIAKRLRRDYNSIASQINTTA
jgi:hypothetical protein